MCISQIITDYSPMQDSYSLGWRTKSSFQTEFSGFLSLSFSTVAVCSLALQWMQTLANKRPLHSYQRTVHVSESLPYTGRRTSHLPGEAEAHPLGEDGT